MNAMNATEMNRVVDTVQKYLDENATPNLTLRVLKSGVREEGEWIYIPVVPDPPPARRFAFYETLAIVENLLEKELRRTVLFVPVLAENEMPSPVPA